MLFFFFFFIHFFCLLGHNLKIASLVVVLLLCYQNQSLSLFHLFIFMSFGSKILVSATMYLLSFIFSPMLWTKLRRIAKNYYSLHNSLLTYSSSVYKCLFCFVVHRWASFMEESSYDKNKNKKIEKFPTKFFRRVFM